MGNELTGAFSPEDIEKSKALVGLAPELEKFRSVVTIPMDKKRNVPRIDRAYFNIPADFEGGDDIDTGVGSPVKIALVKLLQSNSAEVVAENPHEGAKIGALWHKEHLLALPQGIKCVPLYAYSIDFSDMPNKFGDNDKQKGPTWSMVWTTLEFIESWPNWIDRIINPMEYSLGNELLSNIFEMYFGGAAQQVVTGIQSDTLAGAGANGRAYSLFTKMKESEKFKWRALVPEPARLLTEQEQIVSRSLSALVKEVVAINEKFYDYRRAQFEGSGAGDNAPRNENRPPAYDAANDNVPPIDDGGM